MTRVAAVVGGAVERGAGTMTEDADRPKWMSLYDKLEVVLQSPEAREIVLRLVGHNRLLLYVLTADGPWGNDPEFIYGYAVKAAHEARKLLRLTGELGQEDGV